MSNDGQFKNEKFLHQPLIRLLLEGRNNFFSPAMHCIPRLISSFYVFLSKDMCMPLHQFGLILRREFDGNNVEKGLHIIAKIRDRYLSIKERYCFYDSNLNNIFSHFIPTCPKTFPSNLQNF